MVNQPIKLNITAYQPINIQEKKLTNIAFNQSNLQKSTSRQTNQSHSTSTNQLDKYWQVEKEKPNSFLLLVVKDFIQRKNFHIKK